MRKKSYNSAQKIAIALIVALITTSFYGLAEASGVVSAPMSSQVETANGMVRVYLSSLGNPSSLSLTIVGNYSVNGNTSQSLGSGSNVTVGFSSSTGELTLTRNGVKTNMGSQFALRRHSTTGTNGIKIAQGRKPENPYPGDLSFQAVKQSTGSYKLYTVAHVYMENYLYGVLPYEMGNSAHIEALKAQAVAARTYTVRMMQSRSSGYYDVVDTTNDQVYNGTPTGNANCVAAVDGTKGIVVKNGGSYTATYYSASNGGQTESIANAWGTSGYSYLSVKDDPFDLANPDSTVKKYTVYSAASSNNAALLSLLKTKAVAALKSSGYAATTENTTLQTVKSITPHTPKYAAPSKLYTKLDFELTAATRNSAGNSVNANVTVTFAIFTELESTLGMSIQSTANELWSVAKSGSNFVLEARRYGHGLGLSQRGAMYMGKLGYTYDKILGFYFNDCQRVRVSFTNSILNANSSESIVTVEDPASFEGSDAACTAVVKLVGSSSSLAIRAEKSSAGKLLGVLANNSPVNVYANDGTWCFIRFGNIKGYVPTNALTLSGSAPASTQESVTEISGFAKVQANGYLNLRASGSTSANVITTAPTGSVFTVFSKEGGWAHIQFGATVAYASTDFLVFSSTYPGDTVTTGVLTATVNLEDPSATVSLRGTPSTEGQVLAQLAHGTTVTVTRDDGAWCEVSYNGTKGYIVSSYLKYGEGVVDGGATTPTEPSTTEKTATVKTTTGTLRQQMNASSTALMEIPFGQSVVVIEEGSEWFKVRYEGVEGFMLAASLNLNEQSTGQSGVTESAIVATQQGSLNLRMSASAGSTILTTIPKGAEVQVTSKGSTWSKVAYNGISGYVMTSYLQFTGQSSESGTSGSSGATGESTAMVTTKSGSLNLRAEARAGSSILRTIPQYATLLVHERGTEWCRVTYQGTTGYVMTVFLTFLENGVIPTEAPDPTVPPGTGDGTENDPNEPIVETQPEADNALYAKVVTASGSLNLRRDALPGSPILATIPKGVTIQVTEKLSAWSKTIYAGKTGYVMNAYLSFIEKPQESTASLTATVTTVSGSLNLRLEPSTTAGVMLRIPQYATVAVQQQGGSWCYVSYQNQFGYVMTSYLTFAQPKASLESTPADPSELAAQEGQSQNQETTAVVTTAIVTTASGGLNLREEGVNGSAILAAIPRNANVDVLVYGDTWCKVQYKGYTGYAMTKFLTLTEHASAASAQVQTSTEQVDVQAEGKDAWVSTPSGSLNLRESASAEATVLTSIPRNALVAAFGESGEWTRVQYNGQSGYVMTKYLTQSKPSGNEVQETPSPSSTPSGTPSSAGNAQETPSEAGGSGNTQAIMDSTLKAVNQETTAVIAPESWKTMLALWNECSERGIPLADMPVGATVKVLMRGETWSKVLYLEQTGYCLTEFLVITGE